MTYLYENPTVIKENIPNIKLRISDIFMQYWKSEMFDDNLTIPKRSTGNKLRTYRKFKSSYQLESYLLNIPDLQVRKTLTRFRISNSSLRIETGRFEKIRSGERICQFCNSNEVDDEDHFLLKCKFMAIERKEFLSKLNLRSLSLQDVLSVETPTQINTMAHFIHKGFSKRTSRNTNALMS